MMKRRTLSSSTMPNVGSSGDIRDAEEEEIHFASATVNEEHNLLGNDHKIYSTHPEGEEVNQFPEEEKTIQEAETPKSTQLLWLLSLAKQQALLLIISVVGLTICSIINLALPSFAGKILDTVQLMEPEKGYETLNRLVFIFLGLVIITTVLTFVRNFAISIAAERIVTRLRKELFNNLIMQEIAFFDESKSGELVNRVFLDTKALESAVTKHLESFLRHLFEIVGCIAILIYISIKLLLVMLAVVPVVIIVLVLYSRNISGISKSVQEKIGTASDVAQETVGNMRTVRSLGIEQNQQKEFAKTLEEAFKKSKKLAMGGSVLMSGTIFIGCLSLVVVIWFGGRLIIQKELTAGALSSFLIYTLLLAYSLSNLSGVYIEILRALGITDKIYKLKKRQPKIKNIIEEEGLEEEDIDEQRGIQHDAETLEKVKKVRGHIQLKDITFAYPSRPGVQVLKDFNLEIKPGEVVALVGPSGSGKSTTVHLIERFYDPLQGEVLIDGVNVKNVDLKMLHRAIGIVSQEPVLFATSIAKNIAIAKPNATHEEIVEAAKKANAHDFISKLPKAYSTMVGERGLALSGGQKQRIAIARAFITNPQILLLDEATSALDSASEALVQAALEILMKGRTVLIIAHRLSTVKNCDKVCIMSQGKILDSGRHDELYKKCEMYKRLVDIQLLSNQA